MNKVIIFMLSFLFLTGCQSASTSTKQSMSEEEITMTEEMPLEATYAEYTQERFDSYKGKKPFVLFFHADWCSTCRNWEAKVMKNLFDLPKNTFILKVNYDKEEALKKKFNINMQSTAVFIDEGGEVIQKVADPSLDIVKDHFSK